MAARLDGGGIIDEVILAGGDRLEVRFERCPAGWQASFELTHQAVSGLSVVHRLVASTLSDARAAVPPAASYLLGVPVDSPLIGG